MFGPGKVTTQYPDNSVSLELMESLCYCAPDAQEKKLRVANDEQEMGVDVFYIDIYSAWCTSGGH